MLSFRYMLRSYGSKKKKLNVLRRFIFVNLDELLQIVTFANKCKLKKQDKIFIHIDLV